MANQLKVVLALKWIRQNEYEATVSVTTTDSCFVEGDLKVGLPLNTVGLPELEYLTFSFSHTGKECGQIVRTVSKTIPIQFSPAKPTVTAYAVVNGVVAGHDTKSFPRAS